MVLWPEGLGVYIMEVNWLGFYHCDSGRFGCLMVLEHLLLLESLELLGTYFKVILDEKG